MRNAEGREQSSQDREQNAECREQSAECREQSAENRVRSAENRLQSTECRVQSTERRVRRREKTVRSTENRMQSDAQRLQRSSGRSRCSDVGSAAWSLQPPAPPRALRSDLSAMAEGSKRTIRRGRCAATSATLSGAVPRMQRLNLRWSRKVAAHIPAHLRLESFRKMTPTKAAERRRCHEALRGGRGPCQ